MSKLNFVFKGIVNTVLLASLTGCVSLLPEAGPAPMFLMLSPKVGPSYMQSDASIVIDEPTSPIMINSTKIVVEKNNPSGLVNYTYANEQEWAERLPKMLQRVMIDHFKSDEWPAVTGETSTQNADYRLVADIRKFQIDMPGAVEIIVNLTLLNAANRQAIASKTYNYKVLANNSMTAYMQAFDQAVGMLLKDTTALLGAHLKQ